MDGKGKRLIEYRDGTLTLSGPAAILMVPILFLTMIVSLAFYALAGIGWLAGSLGLLFGRVFRLGKRGA